MNKRIEELARQATKDVETRPDTGICSMEKYNARFAELIVQQCILAVEMKTNTHHVHTTFDESLVLHTINNSVKAIKEHMGVE
jgi:hypothetical protein